jgi:predicted SAM-dependent methyltransferase
MKLHLGCGRRFIPGYVHIDAMKYPHVDHVAQIDDLHFLENDSCDVIYACHVVEHFTRAAVPKVLSEWFRVLRPGATIRLAVPDFEALVAVYEDRRALGEIIGPLYGRQDHQYNFHYNTFDFNSLADLLGQIGFVDVTRYDWRTTEHANVDDFSQAYIPHMAKETGTLISLNVQASKPLAA